jgi:DNA-binding XRE family transcriptional regulator
MGLYATIWDMTKPKVVPEWSGNPRTWMRMWRARWDISQTVAAELASVHPKTWQRWEKGTRPMPYREFQRITALLKQTPEEIRAMQEADGTARSATRIGLYEETGPAGWWTRSDSANIRREVEGIADGDQ